MQAANSPPKFPKVWGLNAGEPFIRPIPVDSQIGINPGFASLNDGFPPLTMTPTAAGGVPPFGQDMNGILNQITEVQQWQQAGGGWQFDPNFATAIGGYPLGAVLNSKVVLGREWMSTIDNNMTDPNSASAANWMPQPGQLPVGTPIPSFSSAVPLGYVPANGLTIGNVASNASQRANSDTLLLYRFVWLNFSNSECPLLSSAGAPIARGGNPDADYNANNQLTLPSAKGASLVGVDGMGGAASAFLNGVPTVIGSATTPGSILGENLHALNSNEMPLHFHGAPISDPSHSHSSSVDGRSVETFGGTGTGLTTPPFTATTPIGFGINGNFTGVRVSGSNGVDTTNSAGGNQSHNTLHRSMTVYWNLAQ